MRNNDRINLTKEQKEAMVGAIRKFFLDERKEELGELAAGLILSFITKELAPEFYNQGVNDAYRFMAERCEDLLSIQI